ncbi:LuxR family two component transcriptional regulator [Saccharopolyspora erythraea NRRL 2338]|uniref:Two-component system response regulator n=2 Tax=Saccharopolyspora erythraea TaxID=1836 RepID=A4FJP5_SACEN|nr:response regulator transcription factor [Saccharopolyspora erythraea]EQD86066.1 LuxR family transcriptional regulator [Saccharopolyspora erythraea D]PFG97915.1 LuxR family two component transcriptional regulator [Saccharopolyspora erythraea NRRL 2338]QRK88049.1 response regulator transcription factor [Saccharopolyspora erythraea]CAM04270.1 two-component system response regulator [Saccharopolyspora erythraea NRRL 2338]
MIELVIIAATRFYREGLALVLQSVGGFEVISTGAGIEDIATDPATSNRGVVLLDVTGSQDGRSAVISLRTRDPGLRVVPMNVPEKESDILAYAELGAAGYLTRGHSIAELVRTVRSAAAGEFRCSPCVAAALSPGAAQSIVSAGLLSHREAEIAELLEQGLSNQEIARRLCIALATVKNHVHNILDKLGVRGRAEAAAWARVQRLDRSALLRTTGARTPPATGVRPATVPVDRQVNR